SRRKVAADRMAAPPYRETGKDNTLHNLAFTGLSGVWNFPPPAIRIHRPRAGRPPRGMDMSKNRPEGRECTKRYGFEADSACRTRYPPEKLPACLREQR